MYIYIDVLIITSIYVDYLLVRAAAAIVRRRVKNIRCIAGAAAGSLFSLVLLLPELSGGVCAFIGIASAITVVFVSFGYDNIGTFAKTCFVFGAVSLVFAGICFFLSETAAGEMIVCRNGAVYFDISLTVLIVSTAAAYFGVVVFRRLSDSGISDSGVYTVSICRGKDIASVKAIADTGNRLYDCISGLAVIVCGREQLCGLEAVRDFGGVGGTLPEGWRIIPCSTAFGSGIMAVFRPEAVYIRDESSGKRYTADALVGISEEKMDTAVFNPRILL